MSENCDPNSPEKVIKLNETLHPFKARCRRDRTVFIAIPKKINFGGNMIAMVDCPTCARGYTLREDGCWYCDRPLDVLDTKCKM